MSADPTQISQATDAPAQAGPNNPPGGQGGDTSPEALMAQLKDIQHQKESLEQNYSHLQHILGKQGEEVGYLRELASKALQGGAGAEETTTDNDAEQEAAFMDDLVRQLDEGELTQIEAFRLIQEKNAERLRQKEEALQQRLPEIIKEQVEYAKRVEKVKDWIDKTPRFKELNRAGVLQNMLDSGDFPIVDDPYGAYLVVENQDLRQQIEELKAAHATDIETTKMTAGKQAIMDQDRLKRGGTQAGTVLGQSGATMITDKPPPNASPAEKKAWVIGRMSSRRQSGG
jgi:hypothetical protein